LREARIERSFLHVFATRYLSRYEGFAEHYQKMMLSKSKDRLLIKGDLDTTAHDAGCDDRQGLYRVVTIGNDYLKKFYECRANVLDHYLKLSSKQASIYIKANGSNFDFNDVRQTILKSILLAIDKYDSNKGALTSYINWWVLNAQTCGTAEHEYGIAYTIPQSHRKKIVEKNTGYMNHSVSLDVMMDDEGAGRTLHSVLGDGHNVQEDFEQNETDVIVMYLAKRADLRGCARLVLDIGEYFTPSEIQKMEEHTNEECRQ
jgi:hypothetical protein